MTFEQLLIFLPAALLLGASPGANSLLAFISAMKAGWFRTSKSILGRLAAWAVLVVLVSFGLDVLLRTSELAFVALKWIGVTYLLYLAWQFWTADVASEIEAPAGNCSYLYEDKNLLYIHTRCCDVSELRFDQYFKRYWATFVRSG